MNNINFIKSLCDKYTKLSYEDIEKIIEVSKSLTYITELNDCDVFIDIKNIYKDEAIVLCENLKKRDSLYNRSVVGKRAKRINEPAVLRSLEVGMISKDIKGLSQEDKIIKQTVVPIRNKSQVIAVLIKEINVAEDIINAKKIEKLKEEKETLMKTIDTVLGCNNNLDIDVREGIILFDKFGRVAFYNKSADNIYKSLGYKDELEGMQYNNLSLDNLDFDKILVNNISLESEVTIGKYYFKVKNRILPKEPIRLIVTIEDITELKNKEATIDYISIAIKEMHHRVKNNLQTIASLLRIQSRKVKGKEAKEVLNDSVNRILTIATTHELLSKRIEDEISILEVLTLLKDNMLRYITNEGKTIDIFIEGKDFIIDSDRSTAIALIVNELIQNSIDHGFIDKKEGKIFIILDKEDEFRSIKVIDNGVGYDRNNIRQGSLGTTIVSTYVTEKLKGHLYVKSNKKGTETKFKFKL